MRECPVGLSKDRGGAGLGHACANVFQGGNSSGKRGLSSPDCPRGQELHSIHSQMFESLYQKWLDEVGRTREQEEHLNKAKNLLEHRKAFVGGEESEVKKEISKAQDRVIMETGLEPHSPKNLNSYPVFRSNPKPETSHLSPSDEEDLKKQRPLITTPTGLPLRALRPLQGLLLNPRPPFSHLPQMP
ncbi:hypothetical protein NN561_005805 [Cricetulus griseus]